MDICEGEFWYAETCGTGLAGGGKDFRNGVFEPAVIDGSLCLGAALPLTLLDTFREKPCSPSANINSTFVDV